jgi:hypothetical protein
MAVSRETKAAIALYLWGLFVGLLTGIIVS